jgi:hypothetical protein
MKADRVILTQSKNDRFWVTIFPFGIGGYRSSLVMQIEAEAFTRLFTARYAQDTKNAKIFFFYRIGTDDSIKQSALRGFFSIVY